MTTEGRRKNGGTWTLLDTAFASISCERYHELHRLNISSRLYVRLKGTCSPARHGRPQGGERAFAPPLEIETKDYKFL